MAAAAGRSLWQCSLAVGSVSCGRWSQRLYRSVLVLCSSSVLEPLQAVQQAAVLGLGDAVLGLAQPLLFLLLQALDPLEQQLIV